MTDRASNPPRNPTYPQRTHIRERAQWQDLLRTWDARIAAARGRLNAQSDRAAADRVIAQMAGARDQIADAAKRLPMEVGDLYDEDKHRLEQAVAALERICARLNI